MCLLLQIQLVPLHSTLELSEVHCSANFTGTRNVIFKVLFMHAFYHDGASVSRLDVAIRPKSCVHFKRRFRVLFLQSSVAALRFYVLSLWLNVLLVVEKMFSFVLSYWYLELPLWLMLHVHANYHVWFIRLFTVLMFCCCWILSPRTGEMGDTIAKKINDSHIWSLSHCKRAVMSEDSCLQ